jgi:hypothetical protein
MQSAGCCTQDPYIPCGIPRASGEDGHEKRRSKVRSNATSDDDDNLGTNISLTINGNRKILLYALAN